MSAADRPTRSTAPPRIGGSLLRMAAVLAAGYSVLAIGLR